MDLIPRSFFTNDLFEDLFYSKQNNMKCDVYEDGANYHIEMDIPGFDKADIKIEAYNDNLIVTAEKSSDTAGDDKNYIHRERAYGKYQRTFYLQNLDYENIDAEFINGVLKITIPKKENNDFKKQIEIR